MRVRTIVALLLCSPLVRTSGIEAQVPQSKATSPASGEPASGDTAPPTMSVREAIDTATRTLERMEDELLAPDQRRELLQSVVDAVGVVQDKDPANPKLLLLSGWANALAGRERQAIDELRQYVDTREGRNEWRAYRLLGDLLVDQYPQLAESRYRKALELSGGDRRVYFGLAMCASRRGRKDEAIDYARRAVEADGRRTVTYVALLAQTLAADRRWDAARREGVEAVRLAREVVRTAPSSRAAIAQLDARYRFLIQLMQARVAEDDATADDFLDLVEYRKEHLQVAADLARVEVLRIFEDAVVKLGDNVTPRLLEAYGVACAEAKDRAKAIEIFNRLLGTDPDNAVAREWLTKLQTGAEPQATPGP